MKTYAIYFLLLFNILAADSQWFLPFLLPSVLLIFPLFFIGYGEHTDNIYLNKELCKPFIIFFTYIFLVKLLRFENLGVNVYTFFSSILTIATAMYLKERPKFLEWYFSAFIIINLSFQIIQVSGIHIDSGTILGPLGFKKYAEVDLFDSTRGFRYPGLFTNVVPLGFMSGAFTAYFWILYSKVKQRKYLIFSICGLLIAVLTNTRAVIYSIVPLILIMNYVVWKKLPVKLLMLCMLFMGCLSILSLNTGYKKKDNSSMNYSNWAKDGGIVDRVQGNVYGTLGSLSLNPLFGVSEKRQGEAIVEGHKMIGLFFGNYFINHVTYHNLPLYYLRVYGIIGFLLFVYAYWAAIKYALRLEDPYDRQYLLTVLLFFLVYNLSHNMKVDYLIFWLAIAASYRSFQSINSDEDESFVR